MAEVRKCKHCGLTKPLTAYYIIQDKQADEKVCKSCRFSQRNTMVSDSREKFFRRTINGLRYTRTKQGIQFEVDALDLLRIYDEQEGLCQLSGVLMTTHRDGSGRRDTTASVDRIDPDIGYVPTNIQLVCWQANKMKGKMRDAEFWFWCENVSRYASQKNRPIEDA